MEWLQCRILQQLFGEGSRALDTAAGFVPKRPRKGFGLTPEMGHCAPWRRESEWILPIPKRGVGEWTQFRESKYPLDQAWKT